MKKKFIYRVSRKLRILMLLEIFLLAAAFFLIVFFYGQNNRLQKNNSIFQLNHTLLLYMNSTLEELDVTSGFPLAHIVDRYQDPLLIYLINKNHGGMSETDFYRVFYNRTSETFVQFPGVESILLFDVNGILLDSKTIYNLYLPEKKYDTGTWYQNCLNQAGKVYILNDSEIRNIGVRKTSNNLYGSRVIYDSNTLKPLCITLIGIRATDIPVSFETKKMFNEQQYALYDSSYKNIFGDDTIKLTEKELTASQHGDYYLKKAENDTDYMYHISYSGETVESYSVIRTPYSCLLNSQIKSLILISLTCLIIIFLNILIFSSIIKSINQPLGKLVNMCHEIGKGNFNVRIPCSEDDELAYLTISLNSMSAHVESLINEVYLKTLIKRDLELQMLRSQINPHFLYNTLENMRMSAYTQGYLELSEMCMLLSKVLRYGVTNQSNLVTVEEELNHLQFYTTLLKYCFPRLDISICVDEHLKNYQIIKVIFQPLVENSINHAAKDSQHFMHIQIWGYEENNNLLFVVSDNGNGIERTQLEEIRSSLDDEEDTQHGIGLKNIHRRIKLYYGDNYGLIINSSPGKGTSVTVRIPKQNS